MKAGLADFPAGKRFSTLVTLCLVAPTRIKVALDTPGTPMTKTEPLQFQNLINFPSLELPLQQCELDDSVRVNCLTGSYKVSYKGTVASEVFAPNMRMTKSHFVLLADLDAIELGCIHAMENLNLKRI